MEYLVIVEKGTQGYGAYVPDLPGCAVVAESRKEAMRLIREAIELHLESLRCAGSEIPPPASRSERVKVRAA